jgi:predicted HTH transcriptional regulator
MDITANRHRGADTSVNAHQSTSSKIRAKHRMLILEKIREIGNATCNEIEKFLNLTHQTASARISELKRNERIVDTGQRRLTDSKRPARVYKINEVDK